MRSRSILATTLEACVLILRRSSSAEKNVLEAFEISWIKCNSTVSIYQDNFSCKIRLLASTLCLGICCCCWSPWSSGRISDDFSLTRSNMRGLSSWKSASKKTLGIVDSGVSSGCGVELTCSSLLLLELLPVSALLLLSMFSRAVEKLDSDVWPEATSLNMLLSPEVEDARKLLL